MKLTYGRDLYSNEAIDFDDFYEFTWISAT